jgi:hypothetical protein
MRRCESKGQEGWVGGREEGKRETGRSVIEGDAQPSAPAYVPPNCIGSEPHAHPFPSLVGIQRSVIEGIVGGDQPSALEASRSTVSRVDGLADSVGSLYSYQPLHLTASLVHR